MYKRQILAIWQEKEFHRTASESFKKCGLAVDLFGEEDHLICREARQFWYEQTSDGFANMREAINADLEAIRDSFERGELEWTFDTVQSLIQPYPKSKDTDKILERQGDLAGHLLDCSEDVDPTGPVLPSIDFDEDCEGSDDEAVPSRVVAARAENTNAELSHKCRKLTSTPEDVPPHRVVLCEAQAQQLEEINAQLAVLEQARQPLVLSLIHI